MSTKVDVLAVVESAVDALSETVATRGIAYKLGAAHAAIAELIAADREYDAAFLAANILSGSDPTWEAALKRYQIAVDRRAAALAAVTGEAG